MDSYKIMVSVASLEKIEILEVKSSCQVKWWKNVWKIYYLRAYKTAIT